MKRKFTTTILPLILFVLSSSVLMAQISEGGTPPSFSFSLSSDPVDLKNIGTPDIPKSETDGKKATFMQTGIGIPVNYTIDNAGTWTLLPDGSKIWRLTIKAKDAEALALMYDKFYLPAGGKLYLYNRLQTQVLGAYTSSNNTDSKHFSTELVQGDQVTLEYLQPAGSDEIPALSVFEVAYNYLPVKMLWKYDITKSTGWGQSQSCEINVNCSPEGDNWQVQKRGVAEIYLKKNSSYGWCSGTLINNTSQDGTPYFLTADHCQTNLTDVADFDYWQFYFNYEASGCTTPGSEPSYNTITGCTRIAAGPMVGGSDFLLLLFNAAPPVSYTPYYNGWDRTTTISSSGVGIHHPYGDIKKISTYTASLENGSYTDCMSNAHWRVIWGATTNGLGVTEGGSSGSPIFNSNGLQVGTLTGGASDCSSQTSPDYYGMMTKHWDQNGASSEKQLKPWLDPVNSGVTVLEGFSPGGALNIASQEYLTYYTFADKWGYWTGQNEYGFADYAEKFSGVTDVWVHGVRLAVAKAHAGSSGSKITLKIYDDNAGVPGSVISQADVLISALTKDYWNLITLPSPVQTSGNFYIGYQVYYSSPADTFALYQVHDRPDGALNTAYLYDGNWKPYSDLGITTSLGIEGRMCPTSAVCGTVSKLAPIRNILQSTQNTEARFNEVLLFPNPANNAVTLLFGKSTVECKLEIMNVSGACIYSAEIASGMSQTNIDLSRFEAGIYLLKLYKGSDVITKRLTVVKE